MLSMHNLVYVYFAYENFFRLQWLNFLYFRAVSAQDYRWVIIFFEIELYKTIFLNDGYRKSQYFR